jgi:hypothetical protein
LTGLGILPLVITDLNGGTLFTWPQAYISKTPEWGFGKDNTDRAWAFQTGQPAVQNQAGTLMYRGSRMVLKKEIDGIQFTAAPFMAVEALRLKAYLARTFGPALGQALGTFKTGLLEGGRIGDMNIDGASISRAVETLMNQLSEENFLAFIERLFQNLTAMYKDGKGKPLQIAFGGGNFNAAMEAVFKDRLFSIYPVILLVLEANYPDFFKMAASGFGSRILKTITSGQGDPNGTSEAAGSGISGN